MITFFFLLLFRSVSVMVGGIGMGQEGDTTLLDQGPHKPLETGRERQRHLDGRAKRPDSLSKECDLGNQKDPRVGRHIKKIVKYRAVQIFMVSSSKLMRSKNEVVALIKGW